MTYLWLGVGCLCLLALLFPRRSLAYPEIHYRFAPGFSLLYRRHPEVILDAPWRVVQGHPIPIVCFVKDAHRFPIEIEAIKMNDPSARVEVEVQWEVDFPQPIAVPFWWCLGWIDSSPLKPGLQALAGWIYYRQGRHRYAVQTDNLPGLSHTPLEVLVAEEAWPHLEGWYDGEVHCHSDKTMDQVEFGAPAEVIARMAEALGLDWVTITDHSYDLDVPPGAYVGVDPEQTRWQDLGSEIRRVRSHCLLVRGEEVSCGNVRGKNVHLLVYGHPECIPGRGDGGKRGLNLDNAPDLSLEEVLSRVGAAPTFAAHPDSGTSLLQGWLLNRGLWEDADRLLPDGLQIWNTRTGPAFEKGLAHWKALLLQGIRKPILAGSDAHGDFNRTRCVRFPFVRLAESPARFGTPRTCALIPDGLHRDGLLSALKRGRCVVTDGPLTTIRLSASEASFDLGEIARIVRGRVEVTARSTSEFGPFESLRLYQGVLGQGEIEFSLPIEDPYRIDLSRPIEASNPGYLRLEASTRRGDQIARCLTNPIWLETPGKGVSRGR